MKENAAGTSGQKGPAFIVKREGKRGREKWEVK